MFRLSALCQSHQSSTIVFAACVLFLFFLAGCVLADGVWPLPCKLGWRGVARTLLPCHREAFGLVWGFTAWQLVAGGCCCRLNPVCRWPLLLRAVLASVLAWASLRALYSVVEFGRLLILRVHLDAFVL